MDSRFCAICSRAGGQSPAPKGSAGASLEEVVRFLNDVRVRATYGAVASVLRVPPRSMGAMLGARRPEASWVVSGETGLPSEYEQADWHAELLATSEIIRTGNELELRIALWRGRAK